MLGQPAYPWVLAGLLFSISMSSVKADWKDLLNTLQDNRNEGAAIATAAVSSSEIVAGLKQALAQGVETSVNVLGRQDGFLSNERVRIGVPDSLRSVEKLARQTGQGALVDDFVTSLNRAAEKAVPEAAGILGDAIREMSVDDANAILNGPDDAATRYFRRHSEARLSARFLPIVQQSTAQAGVTSTYKSLLNQTGGLLGGLFGQQLDLDRYVTEQAMDGLFKYIALQEQQIRQDPAARTTELLQKVFSAGTQ